MGRMAGKVAIVTGSASPRGLGFATASRLVEEGASVVLTDIDEAGVKASADMIGDKALGLRHDVTDEAQWRSVVDRAVEQFGTLDVLVNNAGIVIKAPIAEASVEDFRKQLDIHVTGTFLGAKTAIIAFRAHGRGGAIVNLSSVAGLVGVPMLQAYNAGKGGVRLMTKSIALECAAEGIRCNSVHPGKIDTDMLLSAKQLADPAHDVPMRRLGEPLDIANCILFLASDEAKYITGAEFTVDGGLTAQ